jgi:hypothetical protein
MDRELFQFGELRADMLEPENAQNNQVDFITQNILPDNTYCRWNDFYEVINYCNYVLEFADEVREKDPTFTLFQLEGYKSEATFLRSLAYFYLVRLYKDVPLVLNSSRTDDQDFFVEKRSDTLVLDSITTHLERALTYAPENYPVLTDNWGRATKAAFYALLADIHLWRFNYDACIDYCDRIEAFDRYGLVNGAQWFSIFYPGNSLESIFEFQFDQGLGQENELYDVTFDDERVIASIYAQEIIGVSESIRKNGSYRASDFLIWKYAGASPNGITVRSSAQLRNANWIVYRMADILLMKAEALDQLGQDDAAIALVNQVRSRALMTGVSVPAGSFAVEDVILEERARELAFEGKRYFDLMRMGRRNDFERKSDFINRIVQNVNPSQRIILSTRLNDPYGWYLPIHIDELEANINLVQNPFYSSYTY